MINDDKIEKKFRPLNDKVANIKLKFGLDVSNELIDRIEYTLKSFFDEFKDKSSISFDLYWKRQHELKKNYLNDLKNKNIETNNINNEELVNTPKFISEYKKKDKK